MKNKKLIAGLLLIGLFFYSFILLFPAHGQQNISVTGVVPPQATDFDLSVISDTTKPVPENSIITYTITYGSHLYYPEHFTIEAQWYQGTINGSPTPSVDIADYVPGGSSLAYNSTQAIVDTVNQKIDWDITVFPGQTTNQTVSFKLRTTQNYTGSSSVTFPVNVRIITPHFTTSDVTQSQTYAFDPLYLTLTPTLIPTATPTPKTATTTPSPTAIAPTATPTAPTLTISNLTLNSITDSTINFFASVSQPANIRVLYGTSPTLLTNSLLKTGFHNLYDVTLDNLQVNTKYYIQVFVTDVNGNEAKSEVFAFHTAEKGDIPQVDPNSVTFVSSNIVLYVPKPDTTNTNTSNNTAQEAPKPVITVPQNVTYNFRFQVSKPQATKRVQAVVRNRFVLGITSTDAADPNTTITDLIETQNGVYEGQLKTPPLPGSYEEFIRISDIYGNISEQKIADVNVSQPFRVFNSTTQQPIEAAQVLFYYQNYRTHAFQPLPPQLFPVKNPSYTNTDGEIVLPLPQGTYKTAITAIGYLPKTITFTIGPNQGEDYPAVLLTSAPFNLLTVGKYYFTILQDVLATTKAYVQDVSYSVRFFDLNAVIATAILVFLTLLSFSSRIHIPLRSLITYFVNYSKITAVQRKLGNKIKGRIFDSETGASVSGADIYVIDSKSDDILGHTTSNTQGDFLFNFLPSQGYALQVMAKGFEPITFRESEIHAVELGGYLLSIRRRDARPSLLETLGMWVEKFLSVMFETLIVISFIFEISIGYALGWDKTLVFMGFSVINLFLWVLHLTHLKAEKNVF